MATTKKGFIPKDEMFNRDVFTKREKIFIQDITEKKRKAAKKKKATRDKGVGDSIERLNSRVKNIKAKK